MSILKYLLCAMHPVRAVEWSVCVYSYLWLDVSLEVWQDWKSILLILYEVCALTVAPQLQALLLVSEAHAVIAVGVAILAWRSIQEVNVRGAVRWSTCAVLGEVTWASCTTAHCTCLLQLRAQRQWGHSHKNICLYCTFRSRLGYMHDRSDKSRKDSKREKTNEWKTMYQKCACLCERVTYTEEWFRAAEDVKQRMWEGNREEKKQK